LIDLCVQKIIGSVIGGFDALEQSLSLSPLEKIRVLLKLNFKFLVEHPGISRVSIVSDLTDGTGSDNSAQVHSAYFKLLRKIYGPETSDREISIMAHLVIDTLQVSFLRMQRSAP
jgi:mevalonate kinase